MNYDDLKKPFPAEDIEHRIQQSGLKDGKPWGMCLAYVTNRAIMDRLDKVCGPEGWENHFEKGPDGGILCGITIYDQGDTSKPYSGRTKWDGAENTAIESIKGGLSSAMKRAAVQWGIGRYLYKLDSTWAMFSTGGKYKAKVEGKWFKWDAPDLPLWALPDGTKEKVKGKTQPEQRSSSQGQATKPPMGKPGDPATEPQERAILAIAKKGGIDAGDVETILKDWMNGDVLTKAEASTLIENNHILDTAKEWYKKQAEE